ncbi:unnamed protein product, partial [Polarella glacialis]
DLAGAFALSQRWQVDGLAEVLGERLERGLRAGSLAATLEVAVLHDASRLRAACLAFAQHSAQEIDAKRHNMKADEQKGNAKDIDKQHADAQEIGKQAWDDEATDKQKVGKQEAVDGQDGGQEDKESRIYRLLRTFVAEDSEDERLIKDMFASASDEEDEEYHKDHGEEAESEGFG